MPLDLGKLKEMGNLPGKIVDATVETVKTGTKAVKDWRDTNTERMQNEFKHEEKTYEDSTSRITGIIGGAINAIDKLSSSYARVKEVYNHETQIANNALKDRMHHEEEMEKIAIRTMAVRENLERMQKESEMHLENERIALIASIEPLQRAHDRFMTMSDEPFFTEETQQWLKDLHEMMIHLTEVVLKTGEKR